MKISTYSKITSLSILSILGLSLLFANIATAQLSDVPNHIYKKEIQALIDSECIKGYSDNTFKPDKLVTRVETLKFILECLQMPEIYSEEKFIKAIKALYSTDDEDMIFAPGLHTSVQTPASYNEKGIDRFLKEMGEMSKKYPSIKHQYIHSLKLYINDVNNEEHLIIPKKNEAFTEWFKIKPEEKYLNCIFEREKKDYKY